MVAQSTDFPGDCLGGRQDWWCSPGQGFGSSAGSIRVYRPHWSQQGAGEGSDLHDILVQVPERPVVEGVDVDRDLLVRVRVIQVQDLVT